MLPTDEIRRRIVAARILLDISQDEMTQRGHVDHGLDKTELARIERGTLKKGLQPYHLTVLSDVLEVPMSWFTQPREQVVAANGQDSGRLQRVEDVVAQNAETLEAGQQALETVLQLMHDEVLPALARLQPTPTGRTAATDRPKGRRAQAS